MHTAVLLKADVTGITGSPNCVCQFCVFISPLPCAHSDYTV